MESLAPHADRVLESLRAVETAHYALLAVKDSRFKAPAHIHAYVSTFLSGILGQKDFDSTELENTVTDRLLRAIQDLEQRLLVHAEIPLDVIEGATRDSIDSATRTARRNLNFAWGSILFVLLATRGAFPTNVTVFQIEFRPGLPFAFALTGLLLYHAATFFASSRAQTAAHTTARRRLDAAIEAADRLLDNLAADRFRFLGGTAGDTLKTWIATGKAEVQRARSAREAGVHRGFIDLHFPLIGAAAGLLLLWASLAVHLSSATGSEPASISGQDARSN